MASVRLVEHDDGCSQSLAARLDGALAEEGTVGLIVDVGERALDSVLVHLMVTTDKALIARGGRAIVLCEDPSGRAAFRATGLDAHLPIAESLAHAMELAAPYLRRG